MPTKEGENNYICIGTIYSHTKEPITGKKDPTQTYFKHFITLEVSSSGERKRGEKTEYHTDTQFIVFEAFNPKYDIDSYEIGDLIFVRFYIEGKFFEYKKGDRAGQKGIINRNIPTFIKRSDLGTLDSGYSNHKGKVNVDSMSDVRELEKTFVVPDPQGDDELDGLPF